MAGRKIAYEQVFQSVIQFLGNVFRTGSKDWRHSRVIQEISFYSKKGIKRIPVETGHMSKRKSKARIVQSNNKMNTSLGCNNETIANGQCFGLSICGWCYDYGEARLVSKEYEKFNSVGYYFLLPCSLVK
ncbi:hypothetical protein KIN20_033156 [Parelaphostrongylus tenuis]|uniref:Uncharacterized protein n=1 Tax=Parelaphostrongylus tenuis TaxID=148309 RepID=A0AAD5R803_PARTN|nr:hypothetical protein KIN20_033156 [Parelaphostrongylus tenuis]